MKRASTTGIDPAIINTFSLLQQTQFNSDRWWECHDALSRQLHTSLLHYPCVRPPDQPKPNWMPVKTFTMARALYDELATRKQS